MAKVNTKLRIAILGPGAIGGFLASLFWKQGHDVICIGKKSSVDKINKNGINLKSKFYGDFTAKPNALEILDSPVDILFISVKTPFIKDSLKRINLNSIENGIVISLLNGIGYQQTLRNALGKRVVIGSIGAIEVIRRDKNTICHLSPVRAKIEIAANVDISNAKLKEIVILIESLRIFSNLVNDEKVVIWNKLVRLNAIASLTSAYQKNLGEIRSNLKFNKLLKKIVDEGVLVANKEGVAISSIEVMKQIDDLPFLLKTSMQRDIELGHKSEFDAITFGVMTLAKVYGVSVPAHELIYNIILSKIYYFDNKANERS